MSNLHGPHLKPLGQAACPSLRPQPFADALLSLFRNSFDSRPIRTLTLVQVLEAIRNGRCRLEVDRLRQILARDGKRAYDQAKAYLPAVTFVGVFLPSRGNAHLRQHSRIVHSDMDNLSDLWAIKQAVCRDPRTVYVFTSPSGTGLKVGIHVPLVASDPDYKHSWRVVRAAYERLYGGRWDESGKDCARLCFLSYDPELYSNPDAEVFQVPPPNMEEPPAPRKLPSAYTASHDHHDYGEQAIQTAAQMIQAAELGTRHHTRLRAARLLGGYIAGGMLTYDQAYTVLEQALVGHTDDMAAALRTVKDGLAYGQSHPITPEALEAERQAWIETRLMTSSDQVSKGNDPWAGTSTLPLRPSRGLRVRTVAPHG